MASNNPVKIEAARQAFSRVWPETEWQLEGLTVWSGVPDQPMSDEETLIGATNRANAVKLARPLAAYWVGIEGGLQDRGDELEAFAWAVVIGADRVGKGKTGSIFLPPEAAKLIRDGNELATATDIIFKTTNARHSIGAVGALTRGHIDRTTFNAQAVLLALLPFMNPELYKEET